MCSCKIRLRSFREPDGKGQSKRTIGEGKRNQADEDFICTQAVHAKPCHSTFGLSATQGKDCNGTSKRDNPKRVSVYLYENNSTTARVTNSFLEITLTKLFPTLENEMKKFEEDLPKSNERISLFFSVSKPRIGTEDYIKRIVTYAQCSESAFVVALIYMNRLALVNERLRVTSYNMHRMIITALMLAAKMLDDRCYSNAHYARVGGIEKVSEMNKLEREMLRLLDYRLIVSLREYELQIEYMSSFIPPSKTGPSPVVEMSTVEPEAKEECKAESASSSGESSRWSRSNKISCNTPRSKSLTPSCSCGEVNV